MEKYLSSLLLLNLTQRLRECVCVCVCARVCVCVCVKLMLIFTSLRTNLSDLALRPTWNSGKCYLYKLVLNVWASLYLSYDTVWGKYL